jgi:hypothetical protein
VPVGVRDADERPVRDAVPVGETVHERLACADRDMLREADGDRDGVADTSDDADGEPVTDRVMLPGGEREEEIEGDSDGEADDDGEKDGERESAPVREPEDEIVDVLELRNAEPERVAETEGALDTVTAEALGCAAEADTDAVDDPDGNADCENDGESDADRVIVTDTLGDLDVSGEPDDVAEIDGDRVTTERVAAAEAPAVFDPVARVEIECGAVVLGDEESEGEARDDGETPRVVDGDCVSESDTVRLSEGELDRDGDRVSDGDGVIDARGAGDFVVETMAVGDREIGGDALELGDREEDPEVDGVLDGRGDSVGSGDAEGHPLDDRETSGERVPLALLTEPAADTEKRDAVDDTDSVRMAVSEDVRVAAGEKERDELGELERVGSVEIEMLAQPETDAVRSGERDADSVPDGDGDCDEDVVDE